MNLGLYANGILRITAASGIVIGQMARVTWDKSVEKQLNRIPLAISRKFQLWASLVEESGIREVRKCKGFHDEPLEGQRRGQRSVRLSKAYRVMYVEHENGSIELIEVLEVNKHDY